MSLRFEGETLTIGGEPVTGTVLVETRVTDARFAHHFGTDGGDEVEFTPDGFCPDKNYSGFDPSDAQIDRAIWDWIDANERRIEKACARL